MRDLPPMNAVRAFEAAARHLNISRAAEELHVTHGAVSRQIKELEDFFGFELFKRLPRGLELTEQGRVFYFTASRVLDDLRGSVRSLRRVPHSKVLRVSTVASIAARWLVPRMVYFQDLYPDQEIRVSTSRQIVDLADGNFDVAIRYGRGNWPGLISEPLFKPWVVPVCSAAYLREVSMVEPSDLARARLLRDETSDYWDRWLSESGQRGLVADSELVVEDMNVSLQAAIEGQGVALAPFALVLGDILAGRLVRPFKEKLDVDATHYLVYPAERADSDELRPFLDWVRQQAAETSSRLAD